MKNHLSELLQIWRIYLCAMGKWLGVALVTGVLCGGIGTLFHQGVELVTELRMAHGWLLYILPAAGLLIGGIYKILGTAGVNTNQILEEIHSGRGVSLKLLPAIFFATLLTHLGGGSVGREGAALQMGGTLGYQAGRMLRLDDADLRISTTVGMAAFFSALFGTPLAATVFALEITNVGRVYYAQFFPCLVSALSAYGISLLFGVKATCFAVLSPEGTVGMFLRVGVLAVLCALVSVLFCEGIHVAERAAKKVLPNEWQRVIAGGCAVIALTLLLGTTDYNGAGMNVITRAVEQEKAEPAAFACKLLFTAVTLAAGYKGGEVVPSFFVGATFGCVAGPLLGVPAGFAAAIGLVSVFCGAVNCPLASTFLALELFGAGGLHYFALACALSFVFSGYSGIYSSQRILYDKLKAQYINVQTNIYRADKAKK